MSSVQAAQGPFNPVDSGDYVVRDGDAG